MKRLARLGLRFLVVVIGLPVAAALLYLLAALAGTLPGAAERPRPDGSGPGVLIFVTSNGFHSDIVVPMQAEGIDWALELRAEDFNGANPISAAYASFGWGDRDFYLKTPALGDMTADTAWHALFQSTGSLVHVTLWEGVPAAGPDVRPVMLTPAQYTSLTEGIRASFRRDAADRIQPLPGTGYRWYDAFYEGVGTYSLFMTCNEWTAGQLRRIGVPVGRWSPFAFGVMWHL